MRLLDMVGSETVGNTGLFTDPRFGTQTNRMANRDALDQVLSDAFATKDRQEWVDLCEKWSVPGGPVNNIAEALSDPQILLRDMVVDVNHPVAGNYKTVGNPIKSGDPDQFTPPPTLGQDTDEVLGELLGYRTGQIKDLRDAEVV